WTTWWSSSRWSGHSWAERYHRRPGSFSAAPPCCHLGTPSTALSLPTSRGTAMNHRSTLSSLTASTLVLLLMVSAVAPALALAQTPPPPAPASIPGIANPDLFEKSLQAAAEAV